MPEEGGEGSESWTYPSLVMLTPFPASLSLAPLCEKQRGELGYALIDALVHPLPLFAVFEGATTREGVVVRREERGERTLLLR